MTFNKIALSIIMIPALIFGATEAVIGIYITIPDIDDQDRLEKLQVEIGSFFTPNHHFYPLTPTEEKSNLNLQPIFSPKEALAILDKNSSLFNEVPRGRLLSLHLTVNKQPKNRGLYFSLSEKESTTFALQPLKENLNKVPIKIYLIDLKKPATSFPLMEVVAGKKYPIEQVEGKTLFLFIPNVEWVSFKTINFNNFSLPLEVSYHTP